MTPNERIEKLKEAIELIHETEDKLSELRIMYDSVETEFLVRIIEKEIKDLEK